MPGVFLPLALVTSVQAEDIYVGVMKANKILFMGDSSTFNRHDDNNGQWQNDWQWPPPLRTRISPTW